MLPLWWVCSGLIPIQAVPDYTPRQAQHGLLQGLSGGRQGCWHGDAEGSKACRPTPSDPSWPYANGPVEEDVNATGVSDPNTNATKRLCEVGGPEDVSGETGFSSGTFGSGVISGCRGVFSVFTFTSVKRTITF